MFPGEADQLQKGFTDWAKRQPSWRALALVGSWARGTARDDSDLDLVALATDVGRWTADDSWLRGLLKELGFSVTNIELEVHGVVRSWRIWLGWVVELELTLAETSWACTQPVDEGTRRVVGDGALPLVDKDGLLRAVQSAILPKAS